MYVHRDELERRAGQFADYLKLMHGRAHEEAHGPCFIIFEERRPGGSGDKGIAIAAAKRIPEPALRGGIADAGITESEPFSESVKFDVPDSSDEGWRQDDSQNRYIQFSFELKWFCMDIPRETLYRPEAEQILGNRLGFFYLRDRPEFTLYEETVEGFDPFRKIYLYGDEDSAAEDMAYIFFDVWRFPVDTRFYVTAAAFSGKRAWEKGFPIE